MKTWFSSPGRIDLSWEAEWPYCLRNTDSLRAEAPEAAVTLTAGGNRESVGPGPVNAFCHFEECIQLHVLVKGHGLKCVAVYTANLFHKLKQYRLVGCQNWKELRAWSVTTIYTFSSLKSCPWEDGRQDSAITKWHSSRLSTQINCLQHGLMFCFKRILFILKNPTDKGSRASFCCTSPTSSYLSVFPSPKALGNTVKLEALTIFMMFEPHPWFSCSESLWSQPQMPPLLQKFIMFIIFLLKHHSVSIICISFLKWSFLFRESTESCILGQGWRNLIIFF